MLWEHLQEQLQHDAERGLTRSIPVFASAQGRLLRQGKREFLNFASNNYLGLAADPRLIQAWREGVGAYGVGAGSARLINGSNEALHELEAALARFKGTEAALLFNSGYQANVGVLPSLLPAEGYYFSDALNHASIIDGLRLGRAPRRIYPHGEVQVLAEHLKQVREAGRVGPCLVVTESVFSMDGDLAPLGDLLDLIEEHDAYLYLDEAHATGVFGPSGAGLAENFRDHPAMATRVVQMGTLGKALGCLGAYVAGPKLLIDFLLQRARTFVFTTGLPPALGVAGLRALEIAAAADGPRKILWQRLRFFSDLMKQNFPDRRIEVHSPIFPWIVGDASKALRLSEAIREQGYWVSAIRPPTVAAGTSRLRISLMATHSEADIRGLVAALKRSESR